MSEQYEWPVLPLSAEILHLDDDMLKAVLVEIRANVRAAAQAAQPEAVGLTDNDLERIFEDAGGKWNGDMWAIEDADFHPAMRSLLAAAPTPEPMSAPTAETEVRADGQTVRIDRWQVGIRQIVALLWGNRAKFEVDDVVEAVRALIPEPNEDDEGLVRAILATPPSAATEPSDAERLDWLETADWAMVQDQLQLWFDLPTCWKPATVRAAIDAAIRATKGGKL